MPSADLENNPCDQKNWSPRMNNQVTQLISAVKAPPSAFREGCLLRAYRNGGL